jgi:hypothetical protein
LGDAFPALIFSEEDVARWLSCGVSVNSTAISTVAILALAIGVGLSLTVFDTDESANFAARQDEARAAAPGKALEYAEVFPRPIPDSLLGVNLTAYSEDGYSDEEVQKDMYELAALGSTAIVLVPTWYMEAPDSDTVHRQDGKTPSDESLIQAMKWAGETGLGVVLKPHVDVTDDTYRGKIRPRDRRAWYRSYREFINHYADIAASQSVKMFVVGTELKTMSRDTGQWREVIRQVREHYDGPITYAANWDEVEQVGFWDDLDAIGTDAYYPLFSGTGRAPTLQELVSAWRGIAFHLRDIASRWERPVILTEVGYPSQVGGASRPYELTDQPPDQALQALAYRATFRALSGSGWLRGIEWWSWRADPSAEEATDIEYSPEGKRAQGELAHGQWSYSEGQSECRPSPGCHPVCCS